MSIAARRWRGEPGGGAGSADETSRGALPGPAGERLGGVADARGRQRVPGPPSSRLVVAVSTAKGVVEYVSANRVVVRAETRSKKADPVQDLPLDIYNLTKYRRSKQNTCINQRPIVKKGDRVHARDVVADGPGTDQGELALRRNGPVDV